MRTIALTEEQYNALVQGEAVTIQPPKPKIEKWQPKGGEWYINTKGEILKERPLIDYSRFGTEYQTEEQAVKARDAMRKHNRLLAWLSENDDGWVADWDNEGQFKYSICVNRLNNTYRVIYSLSLDHLAMVYMSHANAEKLAKLLNDGVVEL